MAQGTKRVLRLAYAVLAAVLVTGLAVQVPAAAAGKPYSKNAWAGVRAFGVRGPDRSDGLPPGWRTPVGVQASWFVPCLPTSFTGPDGAVEGAYDQWIGLEAQDGVGLLQVGVRSYHLDLFGDLTGYFAWIMRSPSADPYPTEVFPINGCGTARGRITARVEATGRVCIEFESSLGNCLGTTPHMRTLAAMPNPRDAAFIIERFAGGTGHAPYFGRAGFDDAWVARAGDYRSWGIGNPAYVQAYPYDMADTWWSNNVHTFPPQVNASFVAVQPPISYYPW
jgi:hypothetical protein